MFVALLMFLSSSVWGSVSFIAIAALLKVNRIKYENWNTPLFRIICLISFLSVINFFVYLILLGGVPNDNTTAYYPYAIFMFFSYVIAKTITRAELQLLLLLFVVDVCVGLIEYQKGVASFWNVDISFDESSELLYFRRICGINNNSSNFAEKMLLGFIIIYLISPKFKYLYIVIFFIGLIISFNRSAIIASIPLLFDSSVWMKGTYISHFDIKYIAKIAMSYPLSPYFVLKLMIRIAQYSYMIRGFNPVAIAVYHEYSFTSSILTNYCNVYGVKHINVMHGEKLFHIVDAYFRYDECYVWDKYYKDLFISMKADESQFIIALPPSMRIDTQYYFQQKYYADFKYFLEDVTEKEMISIVESMKFAIDRGRIVKYRLHPRYTNPKVVEKIVGKSNIEDPFKVPILSSVSSMEYAVGSYTTVLNQAFNSGKKVILDDITYKEKFLKLKDVKYYLTTVKCEKLSDYQQFNM